MKSYSNLFFSTLLIIIVHYKAQAQFNHERYSLIPVFNAADSLLNPWAGGLNSPQFSAFDLNNDGIKDLVAFEREDYKFKCFLNNGLSSNNLVFTSNYETDFPSLYEWALMRDFNCDGLMDIASATRGFAGILIYYNQGFNNGHWSFKLQYPIINTDYGNGRVGLIHSGADIPVIDDIDNDGDLDILTFGAGSSLVEFHKNFAIERFNRCDTLVYELFEPCWGKFAENALDNSVRLNTCVGFKANEVESGTLHAGSSLFTFDENNDGDKELILGDISSSDMVLLRNGGTKDTAFFVYNDSIWPSYDVSVAINMFPSAYGIDVNNDSLQDILIAPNILNVAENTKGIWLYNNAGPVQNQVFNLSEKGFLQNSMIEVGSFSVPLVFDENADGLPDLLLGGYGYFNQGSFDGQLTLYRNIGSRNNPQFQLLTRNYANFKSIARNALAPAAADIDNDGDIDLIMGELEGKLIFCENTAGPGNAPIYNVVTTNYMGIDVGQFSVPQIYDLDKDGLLDLIVAEKAGNLNFFKNTGSATNPSFSFTATNAVLGGVDTQIPCCSGYSTVHFYNHNGNTQLLVGSEQGTIYMYSNIDNNISGNFTLIDTLKTNEWRSAPFLYDLDNDNDLDLVSGTANGGAIYYRNKLINNVFEPVELHYTSIFPNPCSVGSNAKIAGNFNIDQVWVNNTLGQTIECGVNKNRELITSNLTPGLYFIKIVDKNNWYYTKLIIY